MEKVYEFLKNAGVYYIATVDGDQPHVRPFGTINIFEGKLYVQTGKSKMFPSRFRRTERLKFPLWSEVTAGSD